MHPPAKFAYNPTPQSRTGVLCDITVREVRADTARPLRGPQWSGGANRGRHTGPGKGNRFSLTSDDHQRIPRRNAETISRLSLLGESRARRS